MSRHGRAIIPFGKYKGVRIRLLPDAYLSWLTTAPMLRDQKWWWLKESLIAELRFRGLRHDLADTPDQPAAEPAPLVKASRKFRFDES